jgi:serine/threonine-protein kinase
MNDQYKEPEALEFSPHDQEAVPERIRVKELADRTPDLIESSNRSDKFLAPLKDDPIEGTLLNGRYRLLSLIGEGATSAVYKAEDTKLNQTVAIKVLHRHLAFDVTIMRRFEQEAKTARLLRHPNIVDIRAYEKAENGLPYLVMDLVQGTSLQDAIKAASWLPAERTVAIFIQVCAALAAAHEKGIVHRDLKPSNIMLTDGPDGGLLVKVLDFGVAKILPATGDTVLRLTQTGEMLGSILYMSPEQCLDKELDGRSDCYSLGCVIYETLTGKPPLSARTAFETMNKHMTEMPERLDRVRPDLKWSEGLQYIVFKAMAKDPNLRYKKILDLQDDLQNLLADKAIALDQRKPRKTVGREEDHKAFSPAKKQDARRHINPILKLPLMLAAVGFFCLVLVLLFALPGFDFAMLTVGAFLFFPFILTAIRARFDNRRPKWLPPDRQTPSHPVVSLNGASSSLPISIAAMELGSSEQPVRYWLWIQPDAHQRIGKLKIEPVYDKHPFWLGMIRQEREAFPVQGELYLDSEQKPMAVVIHGALALVVK